VGHFKGIHYSVNVPLAEGMDDDSYQLIYEPVMQKVMEVFQPGAIVVCAGADSLSGDRLGCFNLSLQGHSRCLELLAHYDVPLLVLGGGGYTMRNVSRCWAFETARLQGIDPDDECVHSQDVWNTTAFSQCLTAWPLLIMLNAQNQDDLSSHG
jgi:histone deacetylase 1/2